MAPVCESMSAANGTLSKLNSTFTKVNYFDITNMTSAAWFNISFSNTATCANGNVTEQIMFIYIADVNFFGTIPAYLIYEQNSTTKILSSKNVTFNMSVFPLNKVNFSTFTQATLYWFTQRANNSDAVYLNTDVVYLYRNKAALVASFVTPTVTVDKYNILTLDASSSYDPDNLGLNYTYKWTCPNNVSCSSQSSAQLVLTGN